MQLPSLRRYFAPLSFLSALPAFYFLSYPTVGGLPRGTQPEALSTLIARVLPEGTIPTAEIMKDQSTGIERGFGYVTVPRGRGVKAGVERAISVYNGTR